MDSIASGGALHPAVGCQCLIFPTLNPLCRARRAISRDIKAKVVPFLDDVDPFAQLVGSVNTVVRRGDRLVGYNTDADGFRQAVTAGVAASGVDVRAAMVYGYGGVTNVVVHVLKELGYAVALTGRRPEEAKRRAAELGCDTFVAGAGGAAAEGERRYELLINAAPVTDAALGDAVGMLEALAQGVRVVFDHEMPGACLREHCAVHGIHHIPGVAMYYPQMYRQWELFLEQEGVAKAEIPGLIAQAES